MSKARHIHRHDEDCHLQSLDYPHCECGAHHHGGPCKEITRVAGISTIVIDDANSTAFLYGNILHEDYHKPSPMSCQPYVQLPIDILAQQPAFAWADEVFRGEYSDNTIEVDHDIDRAVPVLVYLNGLKQTAGLEDDIQFVGKRQIKFNFYDLVETDKIEVVYRYEA